MESKNLKTSIKPNSAEAIQALELDIQNLLTPHGYEVVCLEPSMAPKSEGRTIVLFIDFISNRTSTSLEESKRISLDDCLCVNKLVDELFEVTTLLDGAFTLEVSSPGIERPLRKLNDYTRFVGERAKINTYRPLTALELENETYWLKNQKQKNFSCTLSGLSPDNKKVKVKVAENEITIPFEVISKANLEFTEKKTEKKPLKK